MIKYYLAPIKRYTLAFLQVQCLLSLVSLPVLVAWGLPISLMTAVGNFIFNPFVTAFLLCSSLIFFTEILHIPNGYLITLLDWITTTWLYLLSFGMQSWLFGFPASMIPVLCITALVSILALQHIDAGKPIAYITLCCCLLICIAAIRLYIPKPTSLDIVCKHKTLTIKQDEHKKLHLIDHGALGENGNNPSWINYTLLPAIAQHFGATSLESVASEYDNQTTQDAITLLQKEIPIQRIYI